MNFSQNKNEDEIHGCIVCAKLFNVLATYTLDGKLVCCIVTNPGGHIVPDRHQPLAVCDSHTAEEIASAHARWITTNSRSWMLNKKTRETVSHGL